LGVLLYTAVISFSNRQAKPPASFGPAPNENQMRCQKREYYVSSETTLPIADFPEAGISNGIITAKIYLPDPEKGYYRSTRFDWSGAVYSLNYKGHDFYGSWFDRIDPEVINWVHKGQEIVSGP